MLATWVPPWPCGNTAPVLELETTARALALLAVLNSMTFDWILRRIAAGLHLNRFYLEATPLPSISETETLVLAAFATKAMAANPRFKTLCQRDRQTIDARPWRRQMPSTPSPSEAEVIIARGYGLTATDLRRVLSGDQSDRKGLWRYFAARPNAESIAKDAIRLL